MQKTIVRLIVVFTGVIIMTGCPLSKEFGMDETPSIKVNTEWYGTYNDDEGKTNFDSKPATVTIGPGTDFEYKVKEVHFTQDSLGNVEKVENEYMAYMSKTGGKNFMNVRKTDETYFYFYRVDILGKDIQATEVVSSCLVGGWSDRITSSRELKSFIGKYAKSELLYCDKLTLKRN